MAVKTVESASFIAEEEGVLLPLSPLHIVM
jgi:hypothetical protein